ncbi:type IV pilus secretin family protein [Oscillatoria sp. FACHB-1406]|uniref:type IV pilus secretin family protein n=1 Tax=Oscillatoria sp. FACHB-1406 TaxID=2692846 RepID=UPI00168221BB|nr:type IV pilus secretin family protein [Oscillatoria sp. FACHB-1406]MBD2577578.1 secretin and TonB N-terminal domain-containing protein [Oscillatoria sp. FACHB-1406]
MVAPILVAAINPAQAANSLQISDVRVESTESGLEVGLQLEGEAGEIASQIQTEQRDNVLIAEIPKAALSLPEEGFHRENPAPGIAEIALTPSSEGNLQLTVTGEENAPVSKEIRQEGEKLIVAIAPPVEEAEAKASEHSESAAASESTAQTRKTELSNPLQLAQVQLAPVPGNPAQQVPTFNNQGAVQPVPVAQPYVIPSQDPNVLVPNPGITINGSPVSQTPPPGVYVPQTQFNLDGTLAAPAQPLQPTAPAPAFLPRAVPPPVGDIGVSTVNTAPTILDLGTALKVDSLVLKDAPVREVLGFLARSAGLNLVYVEGGGGGQAGGDAAAQLSRNISLDLENASVQDAFNYVLQLSGLQAQRNGTTIMVGAALPIETRNLIARSLRLNQVKAGDAATFLATQGASVQILNQQETTIVDPETGRVVRTERAPAQILTVSANSGGGQGGATGPLLLRGLSVSTDNRLNILTMVGEPRLLEIATSFLTQLDARARQVALNVKIVDVNLLGQDAINSSFSFNIGSGFVSVDQGAMFYSYGPFNPPNLTQTRSSLTSIPTIANPFAGGNSFLDLNNTTAIPGTDPGTVVINTITGTLSRIAAPGALDFFNRVAGLSTDPFTTGITDVTLARDNVITINPGTPPTTSVTQGTLGTATAALPSFFQFPRRFLANLQASIQSNNAKILSDPTLVVQEGQEATVKLVQRVVTGLRSVTQTNNLNPERTVEPTFDDAGLSLTIKVDRIDDNGFVTLSVAPRVASIGATQQLNLGIDSSNIISLLNVREVSSGLLRLRDAQTLILAGIIQDSERTTISKVPILGDIPILGSLFRQSQTNNERREVIVLLTPQILDDSDRFGGFGYNYSPGRATQDALQRTGVQVPGGR